MLLMLGMGVNSQTMCTTAGDTGSNPLTAAMSLQSGAAPISLMGVRYRRPPSSARREDRLWMQLDAVCKPSLQLRLA